MNNKPETRPAMPRNQRRFIERVEKEARETHQRLSDKFLAIVVNSDNPESEEILEKAKQLNAQWRLFCHGKQLNKEANDLIKNFCEKVIETYKKLKEQKPEEVTAAE
jgi:hypothetical protein